MIQIVDLHKCFDDKILFTNLNFTINNGDFVIIKGESGSGKTTLLNMIGGLEPIDSGDVLFNNVSIQNKKVLRQYLLYEVGFVFQNFALIDNLSVKANLEIVQKKARSGLGMTEVLTRVGINKDVNSKVYKLSGGEQQRVALARVMYKKCNTVLADEPTGSLDKNNATKVIAILKQMNYEGKTIIMVTHDDDYLGVANKLIQL